MLKQTTKVFEQNLHAFKMGYKIIVNQGGTSSSKTFSIVQLLIFLSAATTMGLISCVSESMPHIRRGVVRDAINILHNDYREDSFNRTDHIYSFENYYPKNKIEFFSADQPQRLRGGRRNHLYINECNNVGKEAFDELDVRTFGTTWLDFNPTANFWVHELLASYGIVDYSKTQFPEDHRDICFIHSTYLDARQVLLTTREGRNIIQKIESRRERDANWWRVYGLGLVGKIEGLVYPNFEIVDSMPNIAKKVEIYGLDFGWTDPCALIRNLIHEDKCYSEELIYQTEIHMKALSEKMETLGLKKHYDIIIADSEDPGRIQELCDYGWNVLPCKKGQGSVEFGHQKVRQYKLYLLKSSTNLIKESRNFMYIKDKDGNFTDKTTHFFSHLMDARRYAITGLSEVSGYDMSVLSR